MLWLYVNSFIVTDSSAGAVDACEWETIHFHRRFSHFFSQIFLLFPKFCLLFPFSAVSFLFLFLLSHPKSNFGFCFRLVVSIPFNFDGPLAALNECNNWNQQIPPSSSSFDIFPCHFEIFNDFTHSFRLDYQMNGHTFGPIHEFRCPIQCGSIKSRQKILTPA